MFLEIFYVCIFLLNNLQTYWQEKVPYQPSTFQFAQLSILIKSYLLEPFKSCFEDLGCITTSELWFHETKRPINLEPLDRHTIRTNFILFKRNESVTITRIFCNAFN